MEPRLQAPAGGLSLLRLPSQHSRLLGLQRLQLLHVRRLLAPHAPQLLHLALAVLAPGRKVLGALLHLPRQQHLQVQSRGPLSALQLHVNGTPLQDVTDMTTLGASHSGCLLKLPDKTHHRYLYHLFCDVSGTA